MLNKKKNFLTISLIVTGIVLFSTAVFAQDYCNHNNDYDLGWWNYNVPSQYQMQPDQIKEINDLRLQYDKDIIPLQNELRALRIEMRGYMNRTDFDPGQVKDYRNQIRDIEDQIADYRLDYRKNMNNFLTDNQKTYFNNSANGWWDGFYDRCDWDYDGDMMNDYDYGNNRMMNGRNSARCW
jgi:Spy/CpxP family protein refolding chaperone